MADGWLSDSDSNFETLKHPRPNATNQLHNQKTFQNYSTPSPQLYADMLPLDSIQGISMAQRLRDLNIHQEQNHQMRCGSAEEFTFVDDTFDVNSFRGSSFGANKKTHSSYSMVQNFAHMAHGNEANGGRSFGGRFSNSNFPTTGWANTSDRETDYGESLDTAALRGIYVHAPSGIDYSSEKDDSNPAPWVNRSDIRTPSVAAPSFRSPGGGLCETSDYIGSGRRSTKWAHGEYDGSPRLAYEGSNASLNTGPSQIDTVRIEPTEPFPSIKCSEAGCREVVGCRSLMEPNSRPMYCGYHSGQTGWNNAPSPVKSNAGRHTGWENVRGTDGSSSCHSRNAWDCASGKSGCRGGWFDDVSPKIGRSGCDDGATSAPSYDPAPYLRCGRDQSNSLYANATKAKDYSGQLNVGELQEYNDYIAALHQQIQHHQNALRSAVSQQAYSQYNYSHHANAPPETTYGKPNGTGAVQPSTDVEFLRRCLESDALTPEDRYKAIGIISTLGNSTELPDHHGSNDTVPKDVATVRISPSTISVTNVKDNAATVNLDMKMHDLTKTIAKMHAHAKMQRMQQDSDRMARIEAKLEEPKKDVVTSFQKRTAREVEKLNQRLKKMTEDGTEAKGVARQIQDLKDEIAELRLHRSEGIEGTKYSLFDRDPCWGPRSQTRSPSRSINGWGDGKSAISGDSCTTAQAGNDGWGTNRSDTTGNGWRTPSDSKAGHDIEGSEVSDVTACAGLETGWWCGEAHCKSCFVYGYSKRLVPRRKSYIPKASVERGWGGNRTDSSLNGDWGASQGGMAKRPTANELSPPPCPRGRGCGGGWGGSRCEHFECKPCYGTEDSESSLSGDKSWNPSWASSNGWYN